MQREGDQSCCLLHYVPLPSIICLCLFLILCVRGGPAARPPARRPPAGSSQNCATGPFARWLSAPVRSSTLGLVYLSVVFFLVSTRFPVPTPGSTFMIKRERTETFFFFQIGCRTYVKPLIYSPIEPRLLKEISC